MKPLSSMEDRLNYYEHHIGDFAEATAHLSFLEDAAYSRLIRKYYAQEKPFPSDVKAIQRLVGARTKEEKNSVLAVLEEFFILEDDGFHNKRCDFEIEKYLSGEPEREVKKVNESNRLKRHREERALLFMRLTEAGHHAPWNIGINELRDLVRRQFGETETNLPPLPETAPATLATATQSPTTRHQTPDVNLGVNTASVNSNSVGTGNSEHACCSPCEISKVMRDAGVQSQPADPRILAMAKQGVSLDTVASACAEAKASKPNENIKPGYVFAILTRWAKEAETIDAKGARPQARASPAYESARDKSRRETNEALTGKKHAATDKKFIDLN